MASVVFHNPDLLADPDFQKKVRGWGLTQTARKSGSRLWGTINVYLHRCGFYAIVQFLPLLILGAFSCIYRFRLFFLGGGGGGGGRWSRGRYYLGGYFGVFRHVTPTGPTGVLPAGFDQLPPVSRLPDRKGMTKYEKYVTFQ